MGLSRESAARACRAVAGAAEGLAARRVRTEIDKGIRSLDAGEGKPLDLEDFLRRKNNRHGRS
jgi:hypothetical protein